jgi:hypothetical protein
MQTFDNLEIAIKNTSERVLFIFQIGSRFNPGYWVATIVVSVVAVGIFVWNISTDTIHLPKEIIEAAAQRVSRFSKVLQRIGDVAVYREDRTQLRTVFKTNIIAVESTAFHDAILVKITEGNKVLAFFISSADVHVVAGLQTGARVEQIEPIGVRVIVRIGAILEFLYFFFGVSGILPFVCQCFIEE